MPQKLADSAKAEIDSECTQATRPIEADSRLTRLREHGTQLTNATRVACDSLSLLRPLFHHPKVIFCVLVEVFGFDDWVAASAIATYLTP